VETSGTVAKAFGRKLEVGVLDCRAGEIASREGIDPKMSRPGGLEMEQELKDCLHCGPLIRIDVHFVLGFLEEGV
jgi:hypothetical protein